MLRSTDVGSKLQAQTFHRAAQKEEKPTAAFSSAKIRTYPGHRRQSCSYDIGAFRGWSEPAGALNKKTKKKEENPRHQLAGKTTTSQLKQWQPKQPRRSSNRDACSAFFTSQSLSTSSRKLNDGGWPSEVCKDCGRSSDFLIPTC